VLCCDIFVFDDVKMFVSCEKIIGLINVIIWSMWVLHDYFLEAWTRTK